MKTTAKDSLRRLNISSVKKTPLPDAPVRTVLPTIKITATFTAPIAEVLKSPLTMTILTTVERSIPVPTGATTVDVLDVETFKLTDAKGEIYTISSIDGWPA